MARMEHEGKYELDPKTHIPKWRPLTKKEIKEKKEEKERLRKEKFEADITQIMGCGFTRKQAEYLYTLEKKANNPPYREPPRYGV